MLQVDYINLFKEHGIPHVPTFVIARPPTPAALEKSIRDLVAWLDALEPCPEVCFIPSASQDLGCAGPHNVAAPSWAGLCSVLFGQVGQLAPSPTG